jgi:hypothetical protein
VKTFDQSRSVTIHPGVAKDFLDYDKLLDGIFRKLAGHVKQNHLFSCDEADVLRIRQSNLVEHQEYLFSLWKSNWKGAS